MKNLGYFFHNVPSMTYLLKHAASNLVCHLVFAQGIACALKDDSLFSIKIFFQICDTIIKFGSSTILCNSPMLSYLIGY